MRDDRLLVVQVVSLSEGHPVQVVSLSEGHPVPPALAERRRPCEWVVEVLRRPARRGAREPRAAATLSTVLCKAAKLGRCLRPKRVSLHPFGAARTRALCAGLRAPR